MAPSGQAPEVAKGLLQRTKPIGQVLEGARTQRGERWDAVTGECGRAVRGPRRRHSGHVTELPLPRQADAHQPSADLFELSHRGDQFPVYLPAHASGQPSEQHELPVYVRGRLEELFGRADQGRGRRLGSP